MQGESKTGGGNMRDDRNLNGGMWDENNLVGAGFAHFYR